RHAGRRFRLLHQAFRQCAVFGNGTPCPGFAPMNTTSVSQRLPRPHKSITPANDASASRKSFPTGITICVLEEDASALEIVSRLLLSAAYQVRPFRHPDVFFESMR